MARSRIAPLNKISVTKLELCAALLASNLATKLKTIFPINTNHLYGWSDSKITLAWINKNPNNLKTFEANRVWQIQEVIDKEKWNMYGQQKTLI